MAKPISDYFPGILARAEPDDAALARSLFNYDPDTGVLSWAIRPCQRIMIGERAGSLKASGYRDVQFKGTPKKEHRVIWLWVHGCWPLGDIDHINGERDDNRIINLRDVPTSINLENQHKPRRTAPYVGVSWHRRHRKWQANIRCNGQQFYLGLFETAEMARDAYLAAKAIHHPSSIGLETA